MTTWRPRSRARRERAGRSLSRVANDLIRRGLAQADARAELPPYEPPVFDTGAPLIDVTDVAAALGPLDGPARP